jgi:microcin C transport system substrate-binding protein
MTIRLTRRGTLAALAGAAAAPLLPVPLRAGPAPTHGLSAFGDLKYPPAFAAFGYVNPAAPKGGSFIELAGAGGSTFNTLNPFILKGDPAEGLELTFASLMVRALDEPDAVYAAAAEAAEASDDGLTYRFRLRPEAAFHDGTPITAEDVVFSLTTLKAKGHPNIRATLRDLDVVEAEDPRTLRLVFNPRRGRDAVLNAAVQPILSRAYYATHSFEESTLEPPLGSGPYRVGKFEQGRFMEFERVKDWWGADLPPFRGQFNFDVVRFEYYRDRDTAFEGFTAGNYLFREEYTSRVWATRYDVPAVRDGRIKRDVLPDGRPSGTQGWMFNTRRAQLQDPKVREAFALAFDFEWTNANLMFGSYQRTHSYFQNSPMMAEGLPGEGELKLLEPYRGKVPDEVFGEPWSPPVTDGSGQDRTQLRRAIKLLDEAGWTIKERRRVNAKGEPLQVEFLMFERTFEPHHQTYARRLEQLGIAVSLRLVDPVQYRARLEDFDFDITTTRMVLPQTPGDTLRNFFSSQAAAIKGSLNLAGIADPVVDALIETAIAANSREELTAACRALDRVLRAGRYWVPHWYKGTYWLAYWDVFGHPEVTPRYGRGAPETWWRDAGKSARIGR